MQADEYGEAFQMAISHRVDVNLIVDYQWPKFLVKASLFVREVPDDQDLVDLLSALNEQNITSSEGLYAGLPNAVQTEIGHAQPQGNMVNLLKPVFIQFFCLWVGLCFLATGDLILRAILGNIYTDFARIMHYTRKTIPLRGPQDQYSVATWLPCMRRQAQKKQSPSFQLCWVLPKMPDAVVSYNWDLLSAFNKLSLAFLPKCIEKYLILFASLKQ